MSFFYVKSSFGTRVAGGGTTFQTGSMATLGASNVYNDKVDAFTDGAGSGDFIMASHLHSFDNSSSFIAYAGPTSGAAVTTISVDDAAIDAFKAGGKEETNALIRFTGRHVVWGMTYDTTSEFEVISKDMLRAHLCAIILSGTANIGSDGLGAYMELLDCTVACSNVANGFRCRGGAKIVMIGGALTATTHVNDLTVSSLGDQGGAHLQFLGVDLSVVEDFLLANGGSSPAADDLIEMEINACNLNAGVAFVEESLENWNHTLKVRNSTSVSAEAEFQFYDEIYAGSVEDQDDSGIHRDESQAFDGGDKVSMKIVTNAKASIGTPFTFDLPSRFAALSAGATDTVRLFFVSTATLNDNDFWAELIYPDGANKNVYNFVSSAPTITGSWVIDPLATGTENTDDSASSTWKDGGSDLVGFNEYRLDLNTSGDVGADGVPIIRIHAAIGSTTIYMDVIMGLV